MANFVVIVDGEVAGNLPIAEPSSEFTDEKSAAFERMIAALSSNPTIIKTDERIEPGSSWDGTSFIPPVE
jgi:hypothetical protein